MKPPLLTNSSLQVSIDIDVRGISLGTKDREAMLVGREFNSVRTL